MLRTDSGALDRFEGLILIVRGHRVLLDRELAALYGVPVKALNQAVRRNGERFPADFMFSLSVSEVHSLEPVVAAATDEGTGRSRSQSVALNAEAREMLRVSGSSPQRRRRGANIKYPPLVFTEQGVAMLSSVLRSRRAVQVNIEIMRAFVRLREMLQGNADLARKLAELESRYDDQFRAVFDAIRELMAPTPTPTVAEPIGFKLKES